MPPHPQARVEEPQPQQRKGIHIDETKYTKVPNFIYNPWLWTPKEGGRKPSADAVLCYLWCIDKVTSVYDDEELGVPIGVVMYGNEIPFTTIANENNLNISWRSVQRSMKHLVDVRLIRRTQDRVTSPYRYEVINDWTFSLPEKKLVTDRNGKVIDLSKCMRVKPEKIESLDEQPKSASFNIEGDEDELA